MLKKKNTTDSEYDFMWDTVEGLINAVSIHFTMDSNGLVHLTEKVPESERALEETWWVTTPDKLAKFVQEVNAWIDSKRASQAAESINRNHTIEKYYGEALDHINGMMEMAGLGDRRIHVFIDRKDQLHLDLSIKNGDEINAIGEILKNAGVPAEKKWRKWL